MTRKKKKRTLQKKVTSLVGTGVTLGVGTLIVAKAGGSTAPLRTAAGFMPTVTTGVMGFHTIGLIKRLNPKKKKNKTKFGY